jgi:hypothetical protein
MKNFPERVTNSSMTNEVIYPVIVKLTQETSPSEANIQSATQEIHLLLCNPKFHHRVHKILPLDPFVNQMNAVHTLTTYLFRNILQFVAKIYKYCKIPE